MIRNKSAVFATNSKRIEALGEGISERRKKRQKGKRERKAAQKTEEEEEEEERRSKPYLCLVLPTSLLLLLTIIGFSSCYPQWVSIADFSAPHGVRAFSHSRYKVFEQAHRRLLCPRLRQLFSLQQRCSGTIVAWWGGTLAFSHAMHDNPQRITITLTLRWTGPRPLQRGPALPQARTYVQNPSTRRAAASPFLWPQPR